MKITRARTKFKAVNDAAPIFRIQVAVRTSPREQPTLARTLQSLKEGGFEAPRVVDPGLGAFKSFLDMCKYAWEPGWLLLCEDDVIVRPGCADFLRTLNLSHDQMISLYVAQTQSPEEPGFTSMKGDVYGSLAYFIHTSALSKLLESKTIKTWRLNQRVDRAVSQAAEEVGVELLVHRPALAQHIGLTSTLVRGRTLDKNRTSHFDESRYTAGLVTLVTPTGDRPEAFARCEHWMRQQRYRGDVQWVITDDGVEPSVERAIRLPNLPGVHTLCRNLRVALPLIRGEHILIIEDDDFYGPDYISTMVGRLQHADLVGEFGAKYYYMPRKMYRHRLVEQHASLCRTGFNRNVLKVLEQCVTDTDHPSVDLRLWEKWTGSALHWRDPEGTTRMCVGIKGLDGRPSHGHRPSPDSRSDNDLRVLKRWVGADNYQILLDATPCQLNRSRKMTPSTHRTHVNSRTSQSAKD